MSRRLLGLCLLAFAFFCCSAGAEESPLKITIRREWEGARSSAPLSLRAFLKWDKPELLEGQLQIHPFVDETPLSRWTSSDTALSDSEQVIWFMTPRPVLENKLDRYVLEAEFQGVQRRFDPEQLDVDVPLRSKRIMVVGIVVENRSTTPTGLGSEESPTAFERPLTLQTFLAKEEVSELQVNLSRVSPVDLPADALRLLGLDALLLSHEMLDRLRPAQLDALRVWILAGGSLALIQTGPLRSESQEFITDLSRHEWTSESKLARQIPNVTRVYSPGLGQVIVVPQAIAGDSPEWARISHLLLRIQHNRSSQMVNNNQLSLRDPGRLNNRSSLNMTQSELEGVASLEPRPRFDLNTLTEQLMPSSIRGMPFWLATSVLLSCLMIVGPGDYFLLGWLKRRRWTWALFPMVALGFTGWMAHLAAEHNGRNDSRTWISVVDMTPENEVVRTSRLELTYGASGRTVAHDVKDQWWTDLREKDLARIAPVDIHGQWLRQQSVMNGGQPAPPPSQELGERLSYVGSVPVQYVVEEPIRQWAPRLQRITTLGVDSGLADYSLPQLKWDAFSARNHEGLANTLEQSLPDPWKAVFWRVHSPTQDSHWSQLPSNDAPSDRTKKMLETVSHLLWESPPRFDHSGNRLTNTFAPGVFSLLTELSPTAAPDCEDLVLSTRPTLVLVNEVEPCRYLVLRVILAPEAN